MNCMYCGKGTRLESDHWHHECGNAASRRRRNGLCTRCGKDAQPGEEWCNTCDIWSPYVGYGGDVE